MVEVIEKVGSKDDMASFATIINHALSSGGDVVKELVRTAQTNPLVGIFLVYLLTDFMQDRGILHNDSVLAIKVIITAGAGLTLATEVAQTIADFIPFSSAGRTAQPSLFIPSATTLVNAPDKFDISREVGK